jgi:hypothetical protein
MRPDEQPTSNAPGTARTASARAGLSPLRDDRVRMALYVAVLAAQMVVVYGIFVWWG